MSTAARTECLSRDEYRDAPQLAYIVAQSIRELPLEAMSAAIAHAEAFGPFIDPTLFIKKGKALAEDGKIIEILAEAKRKLDALPLPPLAPRANEPRRPYSVEQADARDCAGGEAFDGDPSRVVVGQVTR